ncbi:MAG: 2-oxoacid:ferredoxin oxidoreductase subunit beta, partial [Candidatus Methanodesulfokora sp.]
MRKLDFSHYLAKKYMRTDMLPHAFCPGCGIGIIQRAVLMAFEELGDEEWRKTVFVSGIGCSGWAPTYFRVDAIHALHGRALPLATGIKL